MLSGQTNNKGASIQSSISPNSERSVSDAAEAVLLALGALKTVAQAAYGGNLHATRLDFLAQAMHINLDGIVTHLFSPTAQMIHELILADQTPHPAKQDFEQPHFARRQLKRLAVDGCHATNLIVSQCAALNGRRGAGRTTGQRPDTGFQFGQFKRLDHVIIRAQIKPLDPDRKSTRLNSSHITISY